MQWQFGCSSCCTMGRGCGMLGDWELHIYIRTPSHTHKHSAPYLFWTFRHVRQRRAPKQWQAPTSDRLTKWLTDRRPDWWTVALTNKSGGGRLFRLDRVCSFRMCARVGVCVNWLIDYLFRITHLENSTEVATLINLLMLAGPAQLKSQPKPWIILGRAEYRQACI